MVTRTNLNAGIAVLLLVGTGAAFGQIDMEGLVQQALDQVVDFEVVDKPLADAFVTVAQQTGVAMSVSPETLSLLPYGPDTRMTAKMKNIPLRDGIEKLLTPLGMRYSIVQDHLDVTPSDAMLRIGRKATWSELETLQWLARTAWKGDSDDAKKLAEMLQFRVTESEPARMLTDAMEQAGTGTIEQLLTAGCARHGWTWYPWDKVIAVIPAIEQTHRAMQKTVTLKAEHRRLADVMTELAGQARMVFRFEPEAISSLPREAREDFSGMYVDATVEQTLESIAGTTGLQYQAMPDGVMFVNPQRAPATGDGDRVIAVLVIPGRGEVPIYESEASPEARSALEALINALLQAVQAVDVKGGGEQ